MRKLITAAIILLTVAATSFARTEKGDFLNSKLPTEKRVADLLSRMTVEEKVGQLLCPLGWEMYEITTDKKGRRKVDVSQKFKELQAQRHAGMLWAVYRADPWTRKTLDNGLNPRLAAEAGNALQRYVIENTRLGIPMFLAEEAPHGHMAIGGTVYPTGIAMAATWNPALIDSVGHCIATEIRNQGAHISYGPVLDLSRDPRWSRVEETMGECPMLSGFIGAAMVNGLGAGKIQNPDATIATLKHFLAYAVPEGGQNGNFSTVGTRDLLQNFLPPFKMAIDAGALSIMTSYNSIDGVPCTANKELLTDILVDQWHFPGFVVSDLYSIEGIHQTHGVTNSMEQAALAALNAGLDIDLGGDAFMNLITAAENGSLNMANLDRAVSRVLTLKFEMGLFEKPYVDPEKAEKTVNSQEKIARALDVARQAVTLLHNNSGILPLENQNLKVALVGPNADNVYNLLGDYTAPQPDGKVVTVRTGLENLLGSENIIYAKGCAVRDTASANIPEAVEAAMKADVVVAVIGGSSARDFKTSYIETGAAVVDSKSLSDMESGEGYDRATLTLLGKQLDLLKALKATGKPLVVVYIEGRPLDKNWAAENADALLTAYYPGEQAGNAIAEVLTGKFNPSGRLPFTVPRSVGQIPNYYNRRAPKLHDYVDLSATPLYSFGHGLSYTTFAYSDLQINKNADGMPTGVNATITNTGKRQGAEVVQLYLHPQVAPTVQPLTQLHGFSRVELNPGESKTVTIPLSASNFTVIGPDYKPALVSGTWDLMLGASSTDIRLTSPIPIP